ncbi:MAG: hypothetical protein JXB48_10840 [Candidatus Latescibacteria bacterium]|nr:hypothetical protein [Candidatus Latescibacterota bacterium]
MLHTLIRISRSVIVFFVMVFSFFSSIISADDTKLGPPIEIGGGIAYTWSSSKPEWSIDSYKMGILCGGIRFFKGLSVQGGIDASLGEKIDLKPVQYDDNMRLEKIKNSLYETSWVGLRYEVPVPVTSDLYRINSFHTTVGYSWARYTLTSTEWVIGNEWEIDQPETKYLIARLGGPYVAICARWRFDTEESINTGSWFGSYGLDVGIKYSRYNTCNTRYDTIQEADPKFSVVQVFLIGFVKIRFFE